MTLLTIENDLWQIGVLPDTGASIAFGRIKHRDGWVDLLRPTMPADYGNSSTCASFIMLPWSNRIRDGLFRFRGKAYQLKKNGKDGTAIHGVVRGYPWKVLSAESTTLRLGFASADHQDVNFPFAFSAELEFRVDGKNCSITTTLKNESAETMPGGFGHHPYFRKTLDSGPDDIEVQIPCASYFELENALPTGGAAPIPALVDFRQLRPLESGFDHCLTDRTPGSPIRLVYHRANREILFHADPLFEGVVFFTPPGKPFFAVEPVTNANDGFNLLDKGIPGSGVFTLEPGEHKAGAIWFEML